MLKIEAKQTIWNIIAAANTGTKYFNYFLLYFYSLYSIFVASVDSLYKNFISIIILN